VSSSVGDTSVNRTHGVSGDTLRTWSTQVQAALVGKVVLRHHAVEVPRGDPFAGVRHRPARESLHTEFVGQALGDGRPGCAVRVGTEYYDI
jgi:hypothetical protein